jgi:suppressor for copper-sensitivity B
MPMVLSILLIVFSLLPVNAWAIASNWQGKADDAASVRLISGVDGVGHAMDLPLGIEIKLQQGWHTYWRSPGAAGLPPQIDWHIDPAAPVSENLDAVDLLYPAPQRYTAFGLETIGYRDHVVFPVMAHVKAAGQLVKIDAALSLLVCSDTCVPKNFALTLTIPAGEAKPSVEAPLIKQFLDQVPAAAHSDGKPTLAIKDLKAEGNDLIFTVTSPVALHTPDIFIENDKDISFTAPEITMGADGRSAQLRVRPADTLPDGVTLGGMHLVVTATASNGSVEDHVVVPTGGAAIASAPSDLPTPVTTPLPLFLVVLFAILGGFILNLMPCVLPVLSLKLLSFIGHGGKHARLVRTSFLATAAGILFSFLAMAGMTIALKALGMSVGWGVQFQQPVFLAALILIVTFFAASMWELVDIGLPRFIADVAGKATHHPKLAGDFAAGAFATLLATPCTAPFLGTAVGFALASGPLEILIIFTALGFGMALPYLAVALFPKLASALPKPGVWMIRLRQGLGLILALTVVWLLWVLAAQVSPQTAFQVGLCAATIILLLALRQHTTSLRYSWIGIVVLALAAFGFVLTGTPASKFDTMPDNLWTPFDERSIVADVADGKTVFVDVTADWCLTCKANKRFILSQPDIAQQLFHTEIVAMQADWTNPDPAIAEYLHKYGRYGIPFNIVYGPGAPAGIALPELLTHDVVMDALQKAAKR